MKFLETTHETHGELLRIEYIVAKREAPLQHIPLHIHQVVEERFETISGHLGVIVEDKQNQQLLKPGEEVLIPPGTPHTFWNAGDQELRFLTDIRPPWHLQTYWETMFGLAADGKVNQRGLPNPFQVGVLFPLMNTYLVGPPITAQKVVFSMLGKLGKLGRLLGYRARYAAYSAPGIRD